MRHDKVCARLHYSICKALGFETAVKWYTHMPMPVYEEDVTVLLNHAVPTDSEVTANRPDIRIKNKPRKTCTQMWQYPQTEMSCKRKRKSS
jgi:hypothetical protein